MATGTRKKRATKKKSKKKSKKKTGQRVRLKPADPFELIRWLARSQSEPRKAVAELVQNSFDAGARHVQIVRRRVKGVATLSILDDGEGVIPEMEREEALKYLATHVGHSRKLGLTPAERHARVVAGQYGVGLLGFWSVGKQLELRTRVNGSALMALTLFENKPTASIEALPLRLDAPPTFTEVVVCDIHESAKRLLVGRRLADYLAAELRGQLLVRDVELTIEDRQARGLAQKRFRVVPRKFVGEPLVLPDKMVVEGFSPIRIELYLAEGAERTGVQVACAGTLVADDMAELKHLGLDGPPWVGRSLSGIIDFSDFSIPPGSRRGVAMNEAASAFIRTVCDLEPLVESELDRLAQERAAATDRRVVRDLRKALRGFRRRLPQYELPEVEGGREGGAADGEGAPVPPGGKRVITRELFPAGPLAAVTLAPDPVRVPVGGERRVVATATDADGRRVQDDVEMTWLISGPGLTLRGEGSRPAICSEPDTVPHEAGTILVQARSGDREADAEAVVAVVDEDELDDGGGGGLGIPEPEMVNAPGARWRSRMDGDVWQVNESHEDYLSLRNEPRGRLRYLLVLLAKELVLRSYGGDPEHLERVAEILAHAERNLRGR